MPKTPRTRHLVAHLDRMGAFGRRRDLVARYGRAAWEHAITDGAICMPVPGHAAHVTRAVEFATRVNMLNSWLPRTTAIGGLAALAVYEVTDARPQTISVCAPSPLHLSVPPWVRLRRTLQPPEVRGLWGVRVTPIPDAAVVAWEEVGPERGPGVIIDLLRGARLSSGDVSEALARRPRVASRRRLEGLLDHLKDGVHSYLEWMADRTVLTTDKLRSMVRQHQVVALGRTYKLDAYHAPTRTAAEFDGRRFHGSDAARRRDLERDSALASIGIQTLRFTFEDVAQRPDWCRARLTEAIAARTRR